MWQLGAPGPHSLGREGWSHSLSVGCWHAPGLCVYFYFYFFFCKLGTVLLPLGFCAVKQDACKAFVASRACAGRSRSSRVVRCGSVGDLHFRLRPRRGEWVPVCFGGGEPRAPVGEGRVRAVMTCDPGQRAALVHPFYPYLGEDGGGFPATRGTRASESARKRTPSCFVRVCVPPERCRSGARRPLVMVKWQRALNLK